MSIFEVGRMCMKIAGRDAGRKCVVIEHVDDHFVVVDGDVRRKKVNVKHLEPLTEVVNVKNGAGHDEVQKLFEKLGLPVWETKARKTAERPRQRRKVNVKTIPSEKKKTKESASPTEKKAKPKKGTALPE
ncbi:MAG: 50S ribosomal protein L14e [Nanoarchaeota archaeon]